LFEDCGGAVVRAVNCIRKLLPTCLTNSLFDAIVIAVTSSAIQSGFGKYLNAIQIKRIMAQQKIYPLKKWGSQKWLALPPASQNPERSVNSARVGVCSKPHEVVASHNLEKSLYFLT